MSLISLRLWQTFAKAGRTFDGYLIVQSTILSKAFTWMSLLSDPLNGQFMYQRRSKVKDTRTGAEDVLSTNHEDLTSPLILSRILALEHGMNPLGVLQHRQRDHVSR